MLIIINIKYLIIIVESQKIWFFKELRYICYGRMKDFEDLSSINDFDN